MSQFDDFIEGMHKTGEAMSAVISAQMTRQAQEKLALDASKKPEK